MSALASIAKFIGITPEVETYRENGLHLLVPPYPEDEAFPKLLEPLVLPEFPISEPRENKWEYALNKKAILKRWNDWLIRRYRFWQDFNEIAQALHDDPNIDWLKIEPTNRCLIRISVYWESDSGRYGLTGYIDPYDLLDGAGKARETARILLERVRLYRKKRAKAVIEAVSA